MSGTQSALYGGGSRWITNPKHLSKIGVEFGRLQLKSAAGTLVASSAAGFFTALALRGASSAITVADTFVTVASISGAGFAGGFVLPTHSAANRQTLEITVDGTVYTLTQSADQAATYRMFVGPYTAGANTAAGEATFANSATDDGFVNASVGGLAQITGAGNLIALPTMQAALSLGMPVLRFETSLLVRMKCNLLSGTAVHKQCGFAYELDL